MNTLDMKSQMLAIRELEKADRISEASALASELALNFPQATDIQFLAGKLLFENSDLQTAAFHFELAGSTLNRNSDGFIAFDELASIMGLLARCGNALAAQSVWSRNQKHIGLESLKFDQLKSICDVLLALEMLQEALELLNGCVQNFDDDEYFIEFLLLMARVFHASDDTQSEFETFEIALKADPTNTRLHNKVANFLSRLRAYELASDHIKFIQTIDPDYKYKSIAQDFFAVSKSGSFDEQERIKNYWLTNPDEPQDSKAPFATLLLTDQPKFLYEDCVQFSDWTQLIKGKQRRSHRTPKPEIPTDRKIRIGYVSPDFRNHAVCHLVTDLIAHHDRTRFEVYGYGISFYDESEYRKRIISNFDHFRSLEHSSTHDVVKTIEADCLDICVDLCGYTTGMLGTLFNRLDGPLIVNYLGFPGTLGHPQYDYILADPIVTPTGVDPYFSEKIVRINCCYQPNSPSRKVEQVGFYELGLPEDCFIFCNFNTRQKLNRETLRAWSKIVSNCPDSILWLLDPGESMKKELIKELPSIKDRVYFAPMVDVPKHLGRVQHASLFLDSFPYGAHTTASDAVFSGIPVLARTGDSFQSRVSWSIIHHAGLTDFHADNWDLFEEKAVHFYKEYSLEKREKLIDFLTDFEREKHPYNIAWTTREIERAYIQMLSD